MQIEMLKVGDIVIANQKTPYTITINGWKGRVTHIRKNVFDALGVDGCETNSGDDFTDLIPDYFNILKFKEE